MKLKKNILIADDDSTIHFFSERIINSMGLADKIHKAFNGLEALQIVTSYCDGLIGKLDIILLDLHMPHMDGFQFMEALRELSCNDKSRLQIAVITASVSPVDMARARNLGATHFFQKPICETSLRAIFSHESNSIL